MPKRPEPINPVTGLSETIRTAQGEGSEPANTHTRRSPLFWYMCGAALLYAFLGGMRTLTDYDLGWQMATGRFIAQHHFIPPTDVFSYTAQAQPWIYPVLSGLIFFAAFKVGGYALLSWLGAIASLAVVALLLRSGSLFTTGLIILAIPSIADHVGPRAEMFTLLLFSGFVSILWQHYRTGRSRLWLLPLLMVLWVNLHLGFLAGLAIEIAYGIVEATEMIFPGSRRQQAKARLNAAWPWFVMTVVASMANPWGLKIYLAIYRQNEAMAFHSHWITEWSTLPLSWESFRYAFDIRNTNGTPFILLLLAVTAAVIAMALRRPGEALLLIVGSYLVTRHVRFQGLFACVIVVVCSAIFSSAWMFLRLRISDKKLHAVSLTCFAFGFSLLAFIRSLDLITNRHYLGTTGTAGFGTGLSWWFPETAMHFVERNAIPPEVFNSYNLGGYLIWRLAPTYQDYIDGRAIPFGPELFRRQEELMRTPPDSSEWTHEVDRYGINFMVMSLARYDGLQFFPVLKQFCSSQIWRPVYMDEISAVFVRLSPNTEELVRRSVVDCATVPLPSTIPSGRTISAFNIWANAAAVLFVLGRIPQAISAADNAIAIFPDNANVHYIRAKALAGSGQPSRAEEDYLEALRLEPSEMTWTALAEMYRARREPAKAVDAFEHATRLSADPHLINLALAYSLLDNKQPAEALRKFDDAVREAPPAKAALKADDSFGLGVARGRAAAYVALGDLQQATVFQEEAAGLAPGRPDLWLELARMYQLQGRRKEAQNATARAVALARSQSH